MNKIILLPILIIIMTYSLTGQNKIVRGIITYQSSGSKPEKDVKVSAFNANSTYSNDNGLFELTFSNGKPGDKIQLIIQKENYRVVGTNPLLVDWIIPADPSTVLQIAVVKTNEQDAYQQKIEAILNKSLARQNEQIEVLIEQKRKATDNAEIEKLTQQITFLNQQIVELERNKEEYAQRLAQTDLDRASDFTKEAFKKLEEEGDIEAALAILSKNRADEFYETVQEQKRKILLAEEKAIENYMIRARMLILNLKYAEAEATYIEAIKKDSSNLKNIIELANFLSLQNKHHQAIQFYEKALAITPFENQQAVLMNKLGKLYIRIQERKKGEQLLVEGLEIQQKLVERSESNPNETVISELAAMLCDVGIFYYTGGDLLLPEQYYIKAIELYKQLEKNKNDSYNEGLARVLNAMGRLYINYEELPKPLSVHERYLLEAIQTQQILVQKKESLYLPTLAIYTYDLGNLYTHVFDLKIRKEEKGEKVTYHSEATDAINAYEQAIQIQERLAKINPDAFLPFLSKTYNALGRIFFLQKDIYKAEKLYLQTNQNATLLVERNPDAFLPDLASSLIGLGNLYYFAPDTIQHQIKERCEKYYIEAFDISLKLALKNPGPYLSHLNNARWNMGEFYTYYKEFDKAIYYTNKYLKTLQQLAEKDIQNKNYQTRIALTYGSLALYNLCGKHPKKAGEVAAQGLKISSDNLILQSYLAHAYLFQGKFNKSATIYKELKNRPYGKENLFKKELLNQLNNFEKLGVYHKDIEKVKILLNE